MNSSRRDSNRSSSSRKKTHSRSKPSRNKKKHSQEKAENRSLDKHSNLRKEINLLHAEVSQLQSETSSLLGTNDTGRGEDNTIVPRKKSQDQLSLTVSSAGHQVILVLLL
ncbi:hypothetical protein C8Q75DRAFT_71073 [Abortiporus biennis]|nr:hypothetical protein C8Q75DRAFT_71073 [Abortiporus biennis]